MALSPEELAGFRKQLDDIARQQAELYDALTGEFERQLDEIAAEILAVLMRNLHLTLTLGPKGEVLRDAKNLLALAKLDTEFRKLVRRFGYPNAIRAFVSQFPKTFELLDETFRILSYALGIPKLRQGKLFQPTDLKILHAQQIASIEVLADVPDAVGRSIKGKALQSVGGQNISDMQHMIHTAFNTGTSQAVTLGSTAMATFWRVASDRVYQRIDEPALRYTYFGPLDERNRVFCRRMETEAREGKTWTRADIDAMAPAGVPKGMTWWLCGGVNCRHNFSASVEGPRGPIPESFTTF